MKGKANLKFPDQIDWTKTYHRIAADLGFSIPSVRAEWLRQHTGEKRKYFAITPPAQKESWKRFKKWDWRLTNYALSQKHGLSRERVRQIRRDLGLPPVTRLLIGENRRGTPRGTRIGDMPVLTKRFLQPQ